MSLGEHCEQQAEEIVGVDGLAVELGEQGLSKVAMTKVFDLPLAAHEDHLQHDQPKRKYILFERVVG